MQKLYSIYRHLACMARKLSHGRDVEWHWQHILREFGLGRYSK